MRVGMMFRGFGGMMLGMDTMPLRDMRVMPGFFVVARLVMLCRLAMMFRREFVMLRGRFVMFGFGFAGHGCSPLHAAWPHENFAAVSCKGCDERMTGPQISLSNSDNAIAIQ
jgi:hypothetical protein